MTIKTTLLRDVLIFLALLLIEILAIKFSYYTYGDFVDKIFLYPIFTINILSCFLYFRKHFKTSYIISGTIFLILVPHQLILGYRLFRIRTEMIDIIAYVYDYKVNNGSYPKDLKNYHFEDNEIKKYIDYRYYIDNEKSEFEINYFVITRGISTSYHSTNYSNFNHHKFFYYPD